MADEKLKRDVKKLRGKLEECEAEKNLYRGWWKERGSEYEELSKSYEKVAADLTRVESDYHNLSGELRALKAEKAEWQREKRELAAQVDLCSATATVKKLMDDFHSERDAKRVRPT